MGNVVYKGRVYDLASWDAVVVIPVGSSLERVQQAAEEARQLLLREKPGIKKFEPARVEVGWGFSPPLMVVVSGVIEECIACGGEGHPASACPHET